ncbi:MAG: extracellular solute-binding protein, partial [Eubacteriales bacterium]
MAGYCFNCFSRNSGYEVCPYCGYVDGTSNKPEYMLQQGMQLEGRYIIGTILGIGGFGVTYKAWDVRLATVVAIKEFFPQNLCSRIAGDMKIRVFSGGKIETYTQQKIRFTDEGKNLAKFANDPHVVNVLDTFEDNGTAYIVMEYLDGQTLKEYLERRGGLLALEEANHIMEDVLKGIQSVHNKGIIHRDISPDNIHVLSNGNIKILDFGAARFVEKDEWTQSIVVKKGYAPPEQYRSNMKQSIQIDIYAAGATWYKLITGITPEESIERWERDTLQRPSKVVEGVESTFDKAIMKSMALKPELRFKNIEEMIQAVHGFTGFGYPEEELKKRKQKSAIAVLASVVFLIAALGTVMWQVSQAPEIIYMGETLADMDIEPDEITIWISDYENESGVYDQLVAEFMLQYPEYSVELVVVSDQERDEIYAQADSGAYESSEGYPTITSIWLGNDYEYANMMPLLSGLNMDEYYLLDDLLEYEMSSGDGVVTWMYTGMQSNVFYASDTVCEQLGVTLPDTINSLEEVWEIYEEYPENFTVYTDSMMQVMGIYLPALYDYSTDTFDVSPWRDDLETYAEILQAKMKLVESGESIMYNTTPIMQPIETYSWSIMNAKETYGSDYKIIPILKDGNIVCDSSGSISISEAATENQQLVAMQFIHFMLSEKGQSIIHVYNSDALPINKAAMELYANNYTEFQVLLPYLEGETADTDYVDYDFIYYCDEWLEPY